MLFNDCRQPTSLLALQSCMLLHVIAFVEGDMQSQSSYGALAIQMVQHLGLPRKLSSDRIQRETEIRSRTTCLIYGSLLIHWAVWWTIWSMDNWSAAASSVPRQLIAELDFPRPMEEIAFDQLIPGSQYSEDFATAEDGQLLHNLGLWNQMIPLTQVICQIDELHGMTVMNSRPEVEIYETVQKIASSLDSWVLRLPEQLKYTPENLSRYSKLRHGRTFIALHLGFHHHSQLLYYQFLHRVPRSVINPKTELDSIYANRCKEHAAKLSDILWEANSTPGHECFWIVNDHLLVISSSIHLHTLLFDESNTEISTAKAMLERNFEMMMKMRQFSPSLELSMSRLRAFHRQCQESADTSFKMDQWMLQFLQRYMKPVTEKTTSLSHVPAGVGSPDIPHRRAKGLHTAGDAA